MKKLLITLGVLAVFLPASAAANEEAMRALCQWAQRFTASEQAITTCGNVGVTLSPKPEDAATLGESEHDKLVKIAWETRAKANDAYDAWQEAKAKAAYVKEMAEVPFNLAGGQDPEKLLNELEYNLDDYERLLAENVKKMGEMAKDEKTWNAYEQLGKDISSLEEELKKTEDPKKRKEIEEAISTKQTERQTLLGKLESEAKTNDPNNYQSYEKQKDDLQQRIDVFNGKIDYLNEISGMTQEELKAEAQKAEDAAETAAKAAAEAEKAYSEAFDAANQADKDAGICTKPEGCKVSK